MDGTRILIFGGMVEYGKYSNELYELQVKDSFLKNIMHLLKESNKPLILGDKNDDY